MLLDVCNCTTVLRKICISLHRLVIQGGPEAWGKVLAYLTLLPIGTRGCRTISHVSHLRDLLVEPWPNSDPRLGHRVRAFDLTEGFIELPKVDNGNVKVEGGCRQSGLHICTGINTLSREQTFAFSCCRGLPTATPLALATLSSQKKPRRVLPHVEIPRSNGKKAKKEPKHARDLINLIDDIWKVVHCHRKQIHERVVEYAATNFAVL